MDESMMPRVLNEKRKRAHQRVADTYLQVGLLPPPPPGTQPLLRRRRSLSLSLSLSLLNQR